MATSSGAHLLVDTKKYLKTAFSFRKKFEQGSQKCLFNNHKNLRKGLELFNGTCVSVFSIKT